MAAQRLAICKAAVATGVEIFQSDARSLAALADVTLLVVRMNQSTRTLCMMAMDALLRVGANIAGVIANEVTLSRGQLEYYALGGVGQYAEPRRPPRRTLAGGSARASSAAAPGVIMAIDEPDWSKGDPAAADTAAVSRTAALQDVDGSPDAPTRGNGTGH